MSRYTTRFGLQVVEPGDNPYVNGHKFFSADRDIIDMLMWLAISGHVHDGATGLIVPPDTALDLELATTGGQIGAGATLHYVYTLVNDATGLETGPSPVATLSTPDPIAVPASPTVAWGSLSGTLLPGQYVYVLSAYTDVSTNETPANNAAPVVIPVGTTTNRVVLTLPDLPTGADGFNVYRRRPGGRNFLYVASIDMGVATPPDEWEDDGTIAEDCDRVAPTRNTTNSTNQITITIPDAVVPVGYHWKIYRSLADDDWSASLLQDVVEETSEGSGIITPTFVDIGFRVSTGEPPTGTVDYASPGKIDLTDGSHVTGRLPASMVDHIETIEWEMPGTLAAVTGNNQWTCPYDDAVVLGVRANTGPGFAPGATDVIVDVNKNGTTMFTTQANRPRVVVASEVGDLVVPDETLLTAGDRMTIDTDQVDATAENLVVIVLLAVLAGSVTTEVYA